MAEENGDLLAIIEIRAHDPGYPRVTPEPGSIALTTDETIFFSTDGGKSWEYSDRQTYAPTIKSSQSVLTPRGTYSIAGPDLLLESQDGSSRVVYSLSNWSDDAHVWFQNKASSLGAGDWYLNQEPDGVIYHQKSGNVVVGLGQQGVIVGTPDGKWTPVPVDRYSLADFSPLNKTLALLSDLTFWLSAIVLAGSLILLALAMSDSYAREILLGMGTPASMMSLLALFLSAGLGYAGLAVAGIAIVVVGSAGLAIVKLKPEEHTRLRISRMILVALATISVGTSLLPIVLFGLMRSHPNGIGGNEVIEMMEAFFLAMALLFTCSSAFLIAALCSGQLKRWRMVAPVLALMILIVLGAFMAWLHTGISLPLAKFLAAASITLVALVLAGVLRSMRDTKPSLNVNEMPPV